MNHPLHKRLLAGLCLAAALLAAAPAFASPGYVNRTANLRAGPGVDYPVLARLRGGSSLDILGCISGWNWCEVQRYGSRGWVSASYLDAVYQRRRIRMVEYGPRYHTPVITFNINRYWDEHYRDRPFYRDRSRWGWRDEHPGRPSQGRFDELHDGSLPWQRGNGHDHDNPGRGRGHDKHDHDRGQHRGHR